MSEHDLVAVFSSKLNGLGLDGVTAELGVEKSAYERTVLKRMVVGLYPLACEAALKLGVLREHDAEVLINGLIASNSVAPLDELARSGLLPEVRDMAVTQLDAYVGMKQKEKEKFCRRYSNKRPPAEALVNLLGIWCKDFKLDVEKACPCWSESKDKRFLNGCIRHTFVAKDTEYGSFQLTVDAILSKWPGMRLWFVEELALGFKLNGEAAKWADRLSVNVDHLPMVHAHLARRDFGSIPIMDPAIKYYKLKLPLSAIVWIDEEKHLVDLMSSILKNEEYIAVDTEWELSRKAGQPPEIMLIQIATKDDVHLIDVVALAESMKNQGGKAIMDVLVSPRVVKIGFAIRSDLELLTRLGAPFNGLLDKIESLVDFLGVLESRSRIKVPIEGDEARRTIAEVYFPTGVPNGRGLTGLVEGMLGLPLNKSVRASRWRQRPLSDSQIHYAALDVYSLVEIQEILDKRAIQAGLSPQKMRSQLAAISKETEMNRAPEFFGY